MSRPRILTAEFTNASSFVDLSNTASAPSAALRLWIRNCRLDAFGRLSVGAKKTDIEKQAILARLKTQAQAAAANMPRLLTPVARN